MARTDVKHVKLPGSRTEPLSSTKIEQPSVKLLESKAEQLKADEVSRAARL